LNARNKSSRCRREPKVAAAADQQDMIPCPIHSLMMQGGSVHARVEETDLSSVSVLAS
jgi:hypothetical protein